MDDLIFLLEYAARLPSGLPDSRAIDKLLRERDELLDALAEEDQVGALAEAADVAYYAAKVLDWAARQVGISVPALLRVACAKYRLRAQPGNPKNDAAERAACLQAAQE